jgi:hypothetical protein
MSRYAQAVLLALAVVLTSVSLRRATASALGNEWQASFSTSGGTLYPVPPSHSEIGGAFISAPHSVPQPVAIGGMPVPPPHGVPQTVAIGGMPVPPPHGVPRTVAIGGMPVPPPHGVPQTVAIGGMPVPPPHRALANRKT